MILAGGSYCVDSMAAWTCSLVPLIALLEQLRISVLSDGSSGNMSDSASQDSFAAAVNSSRCRIISYNPLPSSSLFNQAKYGRFGPGKAIHELCLLFANFAELVLTSFLKLFLQFFH